MTIDSNVTGSRIAEEETPAVLPVTPIWYPIEPNSYGDFGGEVTNKARTPINDSRQRQKGTTVDLEAAGSYNQDYTETGFLRLLQGFLFADAHVAADTLPVTTGVQVVITSVSDADESINAAAGLDVFATDDLAFFSGFAVASNNGLKNVASAIATKLITDEALVTEAGPAVSSRAQKVGFAATDLSIVQTGSQFSLVTAGASDFTTHGLVPGSWLFMGSDTNAFTAPGNACFVRVDAITATSMLIGKSTKQLVADAGPATVDIFIPVFVQNEKLPANIKTRTYQIERTLGNDSNGVMSEYLIQSIANELTLNIPSADIMNADLAFMSADHETRTGLVGVKSGTRPTLVSEDAYNTSSDVKRLRMAVIDAAGDPFPTALFGFASEATISITNNAASNKAIGVLGALTVNVGSFDVGGSSEVYFTTVEAIQAVRNNADVTMDMVMVVNNAGWVIDIPLLSLGDARLNVEANQAIKLPLENSAAESDLGHTLMMARFEFLPDLAG